MEKSNELNKFLSYIHMGNSIFRLYYDRAKRLNDEKLIKLIVEIQEIFKKHEEKITKKITDLGEIATDSLTAAGVMGVCMEKMKSLNSSFSIVINAVKATNMGLISSLKFLKNNNQLPYNDQVYIKSVIDDYGIINEKLIEFLLNDNI